VTKDESDCEFLTIEFNWFINTHEAIVALRSGTADPSHNRLIVWPEIFGPRWHTLQTIVITRTNVGTKPALGIVTMKTIQLANLKHSFLLSLAVASTSLIGCADDAGSGTDDTVQCEGGKCDDPSQTAEARCTKECSGKGPTCKQTCLDKNALDTCVQQEKTVVQSSQRGLMPDFVRWAAADVRGVNTLHTDSRGQEYTEYFAVVAPPPVNGTGTAPKTIDLGRALGQGRTTPLSLKLTAKQLTALEDADTAIAGQCVFTSWHADINVKLPICTSATSCPSLTVDKGAKRAPWMKTESLSFPLTQANMQMKGSINSNGAAVDLAEKCMANIPQGDKSNAADPLHNPYMRMCMHTYTLFGTQWRNSDPTICTAAGRLAECGCGVDTNADGKADITNPHDIAVALIPPTVGSKVGLRGFPLGTWSGADKLPAGCRFVNTGDTSQTIVSCDLKASDILNAATDVKDLCRNMYGNNIVPHIKLPKAAVVCKPPAGGQYSATCGATPWALGK
jgi:hypothetical protein